MFLKHGFLGGPKGFGAGVGALIMARKGNGTDAIFPDFNSLQTYYQSNPKPKPGEGAGIGTLDQDGHAENITAAYVWRDDSWQSVATNFKGRDGADGRQGAPGIPGPSGPGIEPTALKSNELGKWDDATQTVVGSGIFSSDDGEIEVSPNSVTFGAHQMSSSIANVIFHNRHTHRNYSFVWQEIAPGQDAGYLRSYSSNIEKVVRVPVGDIDVVNPVNENIRIDVDELFVGGEFILSSDATSVYIEIVNSDDKSLVWRQSLGDLRAGRNTVTFKVPADVRAGSVYDVSIYSRDGDITLKSNANTGFSWIINRVAWNDVQIASRDWVTSQAGGLLVTGLAVDSNDNLVVSYNDGSRHTINLPDGGASTNLAPINQALSSLETQMTDADESIQDLKNKIGSIDQKIQTVGRIFAYRGRTAPTYPSEEKIAYALTFFGFSGDLSINTPNPSVGLPDGAMLYVVNEDDTNSVIISAPSGQTIDSGASYSVPPSNSFALFAKDQNNWVRLASGSVPPSTRMLLDTVKRIADQEMRTDDQIKQLADGEISEKLSDPDVLQSLGNSLDPILVELGFTKGGASTPSTPSAPIAPAHRPASSGSQIEAFATWGSDYPTSLSSAVRSDSGQVSVDRTSTDPEYIYIAVPYDDGGKITAIGRAGGIPSVWPSKDVTIQNLPWRIFKSPNLLYEQQATYQIYVR